MPISKIPGKGTQDLFNNISDAGTEGTKVAVGTTAQRGSTTGQWRYNTDTGFFEGRNASGSFSTLEPTPIVTSVDDGEVDSAAGGNQTFVITGSNFSSGGTIAFVGSSAQFNATTTTFNSTTQVTAVAPKASFLNAQEPYKVKFTASSGVAGSSAVGLINVDNAPAWQTSSGTIHTGNDLTDVSVTISATDPEGDTVSYSETTSVLSGAGLSLNSSTGAITGTPTGVGSDTTYTFTIRATAGGKTADREFSIVITNAVITTFSYTGGSQTFTPPSGVSSFIVYMWAAGGSGGSSQGGITGGAGGAGAYVTTTISNFSDQQQFGILVGQSNESSESTAVNSFGGGGNGGGKLSQRVGGSGGGRSEINIGTVGNTPDGTRIVVAGGGGGGNALYESNGNESAQVGGVGQHPTGESGSGTGTVPTGGTQSAGGTKGSGPTGSGNAPIDGVAGIGGYARGGNHSTDTSYGAGGGGGGGYYGGGGGEGGQRYTNAQSGAGGSSYCNSTYCSNTTYTSGSGSTAPETSNTYYASGIAAGGAGRNGTGSSGTAGGHGRIVIVY